ncbi:PepSY-associated TM helix domain-containing protein [Aliikangiella sp. IMCC44359]|uniref:PepSY-associated TM helix domain-containing protein n=1 Tax=Aliikangiella sp. IMCC44359 TaxID=3459125 RepID=UPI00403AB7FB
MKIKPTVSFVKNSLSSHSWIGLCAGALMYLICLTGSLVVFYEEFERWEQPQIEEYSSYSPNLINKAFEQFLARVDKVPESLYLVFPTDSNPRTHISGDEKEWFVNAGGRLSEMPVKGWTHLLKELHINLHLPQTIGLIIVGIIGVVLCSLIISGLLAHPRIFKDAFRFRWGGNKHLEQAVLHNRLGVWGTPFYFIIGATGAFIGLAGVFISVTAFVFFDNNRAAVIDTVYGKDPELNQAVQPLNFEAAMQSLKLFEPDAIPIYLVAQKMNTPAQFIEIAATLPKRLIYSEIYRFDSNGQLINYQHLSDGPIGQQIAYSVYRLHFGHFDSFLIKILYSLLGFALTIICVSGVNIWFARRKAESFLNDCWVAIVWGTPIGLSCAAISSLLLIAPIIGFWGGMLPALGASLLIKKSQITRLLLIFCLSILMIATSGMHFKRFGFEYSFSVMIDGLLLLVGTILLVYGAVKLFGHKQLKHFRALSLGNEVTRKV